MFDMVRCNVDCSMDNEQCSLDHCIRHSMFHWHKSETRIRTPNPQQKTVLNIDWYFQTSWDALIYFQLCRNEHSSSIIPLILVKRNQVSVLLIIEKDPFIYLAGKLNAFKIIGAGNSKPKPNYYGSIYIINAVGAMHWCNFKNGFVNIMYIYLPSPYHCQPPEMLNFQWKTRHR